MKYFIDTEFHKYKKKPLIGKAIDTIELISVGIVSEEQDIYGKCNNCRDRTDCKVIFKECPYNTQKFYYAISKEFNLKAAWKNEWVRENVLAPIYFELTVRRYSGYIPQDDLLDSPKEINPSKLSYIKLRNLIQEYGKTNKQIAEDIIKFIEPYYWKREDGTPLLEENKNKYPIEFYGYYSDYDWVVFCQLFGTMMDLPKGFPMYCNDLKQTLDEKANSLTSLELSKLAYTDIVKHNVYETYDSGVLKCTKTDLLKNAITYPKQTNEHNALSDAKWNYELYKFLKTIYLICGKNVQYVKVQE